MELAHQPLDAHELSDSPLLISSNRSILKYPIHLFFIFFLLFINMHVCLMISMLFVSVLTTKFYWVNHILCYFDDNLYYISRILFVASEFSIIHINHTLKNYILTR